MELSQYRKLFALGYDDFVWIHSVHTDQVHEHVRYEKITDVTRIDGSENEFFFFKDGTLRVIYISSDLLTQKLWNEFKAMVDVEKPAHRVRSRAGKTSNQLIFASHGLTASVTGDEVDFIELYVPCLVEDYLETIYNEPGLFVR